ncbi:hypothetical protein YC2023_017772 [Brassica napus]
MGFFRNKRTKEKKALPSHKEEEGDSHEFTLLLDVFGVQKTDQTANYERGISTEAKTIKG